MSSQLALLQVHLACQYLMPLNSSGIDIINGTLKTSNQLALLNLYIACQSLAPLNLPCISNNNSQETGSGYNRTSSIDPELDLQKPLQPSAKLVTQLPKGYTVYPDIGMAYKLYREEKPRGQASRYCQGEGGNLAVIDTIESTKYLTDLKGPNPPPNVHLGIRIFDGQYVKNKTSAELKTLMWAQFEQISAMTERCVVFPTRGGGAVAYDCDPSYAFVCEISLFE